VQALRSRWAIAAAAAALVTLASGPASAGAVTFGADLNQPSNNPVACENGWPNQAAIGFSPELGIPPFYGPFGSQSCMWTTATIGTTSGLTAPESGTVTVVRVKVGAATGPMRIDVIRFLFKQTGDAAHPELACCFMQQYGPTFTPAANSVTTVPTDLHVKVEPTPPINDTGAAAATDQLALEVLAPNVPVPAFMTQNGNVDYGVLSYAWFPAPSSYGLPAPSPNPITGTGTGDFTGFLVLMNADLTPDGGGGGGAGAGGGAPVGLGAPTAIPAVGLPKRTLPVKNNAVGVPLQCLVVNCTGTLALQNAQQAGLARAAAKKKATKPKTVSYGSVSFSIAAGKTSTVKVKLDAAGRKLVKGKKSAKVWANVRFSSGGGKPTSVRLTLKG